MQLFGILCVLLQVESYVAHIRGMLEERECLTADFERDNELLRHELHQMWQQQGELSIAVVKTGLFTILMLFCVFKPRLPFREPEQGAGKAAGSGEP